MRVLRSPSQPAAVLATTVVRRALAAAAPPPVVRERMTEGWLRPARALIEGLLDAVLLVDPDTLILVAANAPASACW